MQLYMMILEFTLRLGAIGAPLLLIVTIPIWLPIMILILYVREIIRGNQKKTAVKS